MHYKEYKTILSASNGINMYRGCSHGCIYCDSRSTCYQMDHDFEDIEVKINAPQLLRESLVHKRKPCMIGTGSMCDPYLHAEKELQITRQCLEIIDEYGCGVAIQTKSDMILRDLDILKKINSHSKCIVQMTLTTFDDSLCRIVEPNVCVTSRRAEVLNILREEGIETIVWMSPFLPYINDTRENIEEILKYCIDAGVYGILFFGIGLTLRDGDRQYFYSQLDRHFPGLKEQYIRTYGNAYEIVSPNARELSQLVYEQCRHNSIVCGTDELFTYMHRYEVHNAPQQMTIYDLMQGKDT